MPNFIYHVEDSEAGEPIEFAVTVNELKVPYRLLFKLVDDSGRIAVRSVSGGEIEKQMAMLIAEARDQLDCADGVYDDDAARDAGRTTHERDVLKWACGGEKPPNFVVWRFLLDRMLVIPPAPARMSRRDDAEQCRVAFWSEIDAELEDAELRGHGAATTAGTATTTTAAAMPAGGGGTFGGAAMARASTAPATTTAAAVAAAAATTTAIGSTGKASTRAETVADHRRAGTSHAQRRAKLSEERFKITGEFEHVKLQLRRQRQGRGREDENAAATRKGQARKHARTRHRMRKAREDRHWARDKRESIQRMQTTMKDMDLEARRKRIRAHREHHRFLWAFAPFKARQATDSKHLLVAPYFGSGPQRADDLNRKVLKLDTVWDMHGRCHPKSEAKRLAQESAVESALKAIREAAQTNKVHGLDLKQPFVRFDRNNSGSLDRNELESALQMMGVHLSTAQVDALMAHFDPDGSGEIDYNEFMWGFFNQRELLRAWKLHTQGKDEHDVREMFYEHASYGKPLSRKQFHRALDRILKKKHDDTDIEVLIDQVDLNGDGSVDVDEFVAFMREQCGIGLGKTAAEGEPAHAVSTPAARRRRGPDAAEANPLKSVHEMLDDMLLTSQKLQAELKAVG